jgi:hypothetical protein
MPYIGSESRVLLDKESIGLISELEARGWPPGDVNYTLTQMLVSWWNHHPKYITICLVMGTLICVAFEFYRRVAAGYEIQKQLENGDVYDHHRL